MANEEHLAILRQGVEAWNRWRRDSAVKPDLRGADLANIRNGLHSRIHFGDADLREVNFTRCSLSQVNFRWANLERADLKHAILERANLEACNLQKTNFTRANLEEAILFRANLSGANFTDAFIGWTIFADVNLAQAEKLETVRHGARSTLGIDTLYRSSGNIPEVFLRGCGVPDSMIEYARSLVAAERPIDYYSCFISYSSHDQALAERLHADLQAKGVRCWFAPHDLTPGSYIVRGIDEAIRLHDKVVLLLSEAAVKSTWIAYEVNLSLTREAREGRIVLYPVRLDNTILTTAAGWATELRDARHIGDFRQWKDHDVYQAAFARLLRDLRAG